MKIVGATGLGGFFNQSIGIDKTNTFQLLYTPTLICLPPIGGATIFQ